MCKENRAINMCLGEAYCTECCKEEYFNSNDPFTTPSKCKKCGGEMTTKQRELEYQKEIRNKNRPKEDQFFIDLLESLKNNFINDNQYYGSEIKLIINGYIKRME
jgi:hypothetical protein